MLGIAFGAVHDPGAETSSLGMGIHDHTFSASCAAAFRSGNGSMRRNIRFVPDAVDQGGKCATFSLFSPRLPPADRPAPPPLL